MQLGASPDTAPPLKRKATSDPDLSSSPATHPTPQEMRQEYLGLHESLSTQLVALKESVTALHNEMLKCMRTLMPPLNPPHDTAAATTPLPNDADPDADL